MRKRFASVSAVFFAYQPAHSALVPHGGSVNGGTYLLGPEKSLIQFAYGNLFYNSYNSMKTKQTGKISNSNIRIRRNYEIN